MGTRLVSDSLCSKMPAIDEDEDEKAMKNFL